MRQAFIIFSPRLALGTPENAGVTQHIRPLLRRRESKGEAAIYDFLPTLGVGDPRECMGYVALLPSSTPQECRGEAATSHFLPPQLALGTPENAGVT